MLEPVDTADTTAFDYVSPSARMVLADYFGFRS